MPNGGVYEHSQQATLVEQAESAMTTIENLEEKLKKAYVEIKKVKDENEAYKMVLLSLKKSKKK